MNKSLKYFGFTVLTIIILLLIIPLLIPLENYKDRIAGEVKKATGRDLIIDGKISLGLIPTPTVKLHNVRLSSLPNAQIPSFLEVKTITVALAPFKLITGKIAVSFIELEQPEINLETLASGINSWEFSKPTSNISDQPIHDAASNSSTPPFEIQRIIIKRGKVQYIQGNAKTIINDIDIDSRIESLKGPIAFNLNFNFLNQGFDLTGEIQEIGEIIPITVVLKVLGDNLNIAGVIKPQTSSFSGELKLQGNLKNFKQFAPDIKIPESLQQDYKFTANILADKEKVTIDSINLVLGALQANGTGNYSFKESNGSVRINLNPGNINISLSSQKTDQGELKGAFYIQAQTIKLLMEAIKIDTGFLPAFLNKTFSFSTDGSYKNQNLLLRNINFILGNAITLKGVLGVKNFSQASKSVFYDLSTDNGSSLISLSGVKLPFSIANLSVKGETTKNNDNFSTNTYINTAKVDTHVQGNITLGKAIIPSIQVNSSGNNLSQTLQSLLETPVNPRLGAFSLSANIQGDLTKTLKVILDKGSFVIGNNTAILGAKAVLTLNEIRPKISINLEASSVNLDDLVGSGASEVAMASQKSLGKDIQVARDEGRWSRSKIDLSALRSFDGDLNLSLQKLIKGSLVFDNIKAKMLLKNGALDLNSLTANLYGGRLEGGAHLSAQGQQALSLNANLKGAELKNIIPERKAIKITQGNFNLSANLKSEGGSQYQYVSNLSGNVNFDGSNGRLSGINLQKAIDALTHIKNIENVLGLLDNSFSGGETVFKTIVGNLTIDKGLANLNQFKLDAGKLTAAATGNINIPKYWMDIVSTISVDVNNMPPFSVHLYGMLDDPQHKLDTKALTKHIVQNVLTNIIDNVKNGKGKPEDIIKGIIGFGNKKKTDSTDDQQRGEENTDTRKEDSNPANILIKKGLKGLFK